MRKILLLIAVTLITTPAWSKTVSDSLVKNLSCDNISASEIYKKIDTSQFSAKYHLPITNWSFDGGLYKLANCWALSRAQRLFFYLNRWNSKVDTKPSVAKVKGLLDIIRGSAPYSQEEDSWILEAPLKHLQVFGAAESNYEKDTGLYEGLNIGINQEFSNGQIKVRNFKTEIQYYQKHRFGRFLKNSKYIIGSGSRSPKKNLKTRDALIQEVEENRLPMVVLRTLRTTQHVVLVKRYTVRANGDIDFFVYDSNLPKNDQILTFRNADQRFYAPVMAEEFTHSKNTKDPLGVYIVDQDEHDPIEAALVAHYTALCRIY